MVVSTNFSRAIRVAAAAKPYAFNLRASSSSYLRTLSARNANTTNAGAHAYRKPGSVRSFAARATNKMCITTTTSAKGEAAKAEDKPKATLLKDYKEYPYAIQDVSVA